MINNKISRRSFLQGSGGYLLSVPFFSSLISEKVLAQTASQYRFVFFGSYFGRDIEQWYPNMDAKYAHGSGVDLTYYTPLSEVIAQEGKISYSFGNPIFNQLSNKISLIRGLDLLQLDGGHSFTPALTASGSIGGRPTFGYSIDAILEESKTFNKTTPRLGALRSAVHSEQHAFGKWSFSSKNGNTQNLDVEYSSKSFYDRFLNPNNIPDINSSTAEQQLVTNRVFEDFQRMMNSTKIASNDKKRLDNYMSLLRSIETRWSIPLKSCSSASNPAGLLDTSESLQSSMIDLEIAALACGLTNTVVHHIHQWDSNPKAAQNDYHSAAHSGKAKQIEVTNEATPTKSLQSTFNRWSLDRVAEFVGKLNQIDDPLNPGKKLLDTTICILGNTESRGFHVYYDMPVAIISGVPELQMGQYIDYRPRPHVVVNPATKLIAGVPYNNFLITLFKVFGITASEYQKFGQIGFGSYEGFAKSLSSHYSNHIKNKRNDPLPFLYKG